MSATNIFGYIRFSYLGRSDARLSHINLEERIQTLYADSRMEERFYLFEKICLPSLRWQTDQDFKVVILASPEMPDKFKERLEASVRDIPQAEILYDIADHVTYAINPWLEKQTVVQNHRTAHFRLDDDDALASHFIASLRHQLSFLPDYTLISMPLGLYLTDDGTEAKMLAKFEPYIAIGLSIINPPGLIQNPYQMRHAQQYKNVPSFMQPSIFSYIHTAHRYSDTQAAQRKKTQHAQAFHDDTWAKTPRRYKDSIKRHFGNNSLNYYQVLIKNTPANMVK